jgi:uncharacterized protein with HEPN domain
MSNGILINMFMDINESLDLIQKRFSKISSYSDFIINEDGLEKLDSISMRLQVIGETLKKISNSSPYFLEKYDEIEWKKIIGLRDIISHNYFDIDAEIIFDICENHIPNLSKAVNKILSEIKE